MKAHVIYRKGKQLIAFYNKDSAKEVAEKLNHSNVNTMYIKNINCFLLPDHYHENLQCKRFIKTLIKDYGKRNN